MIVPRFRNFPEILMDVRQPPELCCLCGSRRQIGMSDGDTNGLVKLASGPLIGWPQV